MKFLTTKKVLVVVTLLALTLTLNEFFSPRARTPAPNNRAARPTPTPVSRTQEKIPDLNSSDPGSLGEKILSQLPYAGENFIVEYFLKSKTLNVHILSGKFPEEKKRALAWFKENGVENPESLTISWSKNNRFVEE